MLCRTLELHAETIGFCTHWHLGQTLSSLCSILSCSVALAWALARRTGRANPLQHDNTVRLTGRYRLQLVH